MLHVNSSRPTAEPASLAACLHALLEDIKDGHSYDEIISLLGVGAAVIAVPDRCVGRWCEYAQDAALLDTAGLLGLRLRAMHPPHAAAALEDSAEFAGHYRDSYLPLMEEAVRSGQKLLVWRGWPAPAEHSWGIIKDHDERGLIGNPDSGTELIPFTGPALQVYTVEDIHSPPPDRQTATTHFEHTRRIAMTFWYGQLPLGNGILSGPPAYNAWRAALHTSPANNCTPTCYVSLAKVLHARRRSLTTWLRDIAPGLADRQRHAASAWADACTDIIKQLELLTDATEVAALMDTPAGRQQLSATIESIERCEADLMTRLPNTMPGE
ncbi:MAG: hypothetical protein ABIG44_16255 [Planctomycetota bacterium]